MRQINHKTVTLCLLFSFCGRLIASAFDNVITTTTSLSRPTSPLDCMHHGSRQDRTVVHVNGIVTSHTELFSVKGCL